VQGAGFTVQICLERLYGMRKQLSIVQCSTLSNDPACGAASGHGTIAG